MAVSILLEWFLLLWVYALTVLIFNYIGINTLTYWGARFLWVVSVPFSGYLMGIVSASCWRRQL